MGYKPSPQNDVHKSLGIKMTRERFELMSEIYVKEFSMRIENVQNLN